MVRMLVIRAADHGFEPQWDQTKDYNIGIWCFHSKYKTGIRAKIGCLIFRIMCPNEATCLPMVLYFSEQLAL